jgi:hypothetical protein
LSIHIALPALKFRDFGRPFAPPDESLGPMHEHGDTAIINGERAETAMGDDLDGQSRRPP